MSISVSVYFFIEGIRAHWKDSVKPGAAPVLCRHLQVGVWPGTADWILSASLLPIELFWYSPTTAAPREKKNVVSCNFELIAVDERTPFKEVLQKVGSCQKARRVCAFKAQLSSAGYFSKTLSFVNTYSNLHVDFD